MLGTYKITYCKNGFTQMHHLISNELYNNLVIPTKNRIYELECEWSNTSKKNKQKRLEIENLIKKEKGKIKFCSPYFLIGSPLYNAIFNGGKLILPEYEGGTHYIYIERIESN